MRECEFGIVLVHCNINDVSHRLVSGSFNAGVGASEQERAVPGTPADQVREPAPRAGPTAASVRPSSGVHVPGIARQEIFETAISWNFNNYCFNDNTVQSNAVLFDFFLIDEECFSLFFSFAINHLLRA